MERKIPDWFTVGEEVTEPTMKRISEAVQKCELPLQLQYLPMQAHWFFRDSILMANEANRKGSHANALALTRQCIETISIMELGLSRHHRRNEILGKWEKGKASPGQLRQWLAKNAWPQYGSGIWAENWETFMGHLSKAIQPYAHYTAQLAQWQSKTHFVEPDKMSAIVEFAPQAYDPQKATRITLYHTILTYTLARIWVATAQDKDNEFIALTNRLGKALGKSKYLDGNQTNWEHQFWAMMWSRDGNTLLE
jgi:hypothetical protein